MIKTLRIFAKDSRHLWREIALTLAMVAAFAATDRFLADTAHDAYKGLDAVAIWINILMALCFCLLSARAINDEPLVGDRQFWITRPFGWGHIFAAKVLFIAVWTVLPLYVADCAILVHFGIFTPVVLGLLALKLFAAALIFTPPLFAIAVVTGNIGRGFLAIIGLVLYVGLIAYFNSLLNLRVETHSIPQFIDPIGTGCVILCALICTGVVLLQYARRRTSLSITLLLALVVALTSITLFALHTRRTLGYHTVVSAPFTLSVASKKLIYNRRFDPRNGDIATLPELPLLISGIPAGHMVRIEARRLILHDAFGHTAEFGWRGYNGNVVADADDALAIEFFGKNRTVDRHVTATVDYAFEEYTQGSPQSVAYADRFRTPGHGLCTHQKSDYLACVFPVRSLGNTTYVSWTRSSDCNSHTATQRDAAWLSTDGAIMGEEPFGPVVGENIGFHDASPDTLTPTIQELAPPPGSTAVHSTFCPGTPVAFTTYHFLRRGIATYTFPNIDLGTDDHTRAFH